MANIKVSELPVATSFDDSDYLMIVQSNASKKITGANFNDKLKANIMTGSTTTTQTTGNNTNDKIPITTTVSVGNKLSKTNDGGIKIGAGVSYIKASGSILYSTISGADGRHHIMIYKNNSNVSSLVFRLRGNWDSINIQPILIPVNTNDVIYLYTRTQDGSGATVYNANLTVEVVE